MTAAEEGPDSLADWCRVRREVVWEGLGTGGVTGPVVPDTDGVTAWCAGPVSRRDPVRARRLLAAYEAVRSDAAHATAERAEAAHAVAERTDGARDVRPLTFALLSGWQRVVLGTRDAPFRRGDAYAKRGRERYGLTARTRPDFAACLHESGDRSVPLEARAARAYLDVAFFHPFDDGNARAALLALTFVLAREQVVLRDVGPLQTTRYADDAEGAADLALLVGILVRASARRVRHAGAP
ncbi:Fic family protein [Streptomyces sp. NBC_00111]|uniref:Fic family protein n=1 Tax=Streptomyces sp. NBC_00111 TaxID=2975655 RepID=UPI0032461DF1